MMPSGRSPSRPRPPSRACGTPRIHLTIPGRRAKPTPSACSPPMRCRSTSVIPVAFETPTPKPTDLPELHPDRPVRGRHPGLPGAVLVPGAAPAGAQWMIFLMAITAGCWSSWGWIRLWKPWTRPRRCRGHSRGSAWSASAWWAPSCCWMPSQNARSPAGRSEASQRLSLAYHDRRRHRPAQPGRRAGDRRSLQCRRDRPGRLPGGRLHHPEHHRRAGHHRPGAARPARRAATWR